MQAFYMYISRILKILCLSILGLLGIDLLCDTRIVEKIISLPSTISSAIKFKLNDFKPTEKIDVAINGNIRVEILDDKNICVVGTYADFLQSRFQAECGSFLRGIDSPLANLKDWSRNVFYNIMGAEIILKYRPIIAKAYQDYNSFEFNNGLKIKNGGYWINPIGQADFPSSTNGKPKLTYNAEVAHYAFLELETPLKAGVRYTIKTPLGEVATFSYPQADGNKIIKLNQVGYAPNAEKKFAYIGTWRGTLGALPLQHLQDKNFSILSLPDRKVVFTGKLEKRQADPKYKTGSAFTGENTYQADFSKLKKEGKFILHIDSLGESMPFKISNDSVGEAFFVHAKGLYHKRCGIAKESPYTNWHSGVCHKIIYQSNFPPNNKHYKPDSKRKDCGFFDKNGKQINVSQFELISLNANTNTPLNACGGWHDAADYDRRPYHYDVVCDILTSYIYKPENFSDGQLNIPESKNGIADIIDEAIWGMKLWKNLQNQNGSVGGWIEADSHPKEYNPHIDKQPYFLSASTRESTMQYASHASMLSLALKNAGKIKESKEWLDSAKKAYHWAKLSINRFSAEYVYPENPNAKNSQLVKIIYKESVDIPSEFIFKGAFNLYLLTDDKIYLNDCVRIAKDMTKKFIETTWRINPFFFSEFLKYGSGIKELSELHSEYKKRALMYADMRLGWLENAYPYRIAWYPHNHPYVSHMAWGNFHPFRNAKYFINAYELTKDKKYYTAVSLCNDFHNGANPFGQTMTSGLGKIYPVKFLDLPSYSDNVSEYVLGITPYRNTFGINRESLKLGYALIYPHRKDRNFTPTPIMLLPKSTIGDYKNIENFSKKIGNLLPIWRRYTNVEAYSVSASEYTVSETIAPAMSVCGWLLEPNFSPSDELKNRNPAKDYRKLDGYAPLP
ncbi:MAG: hypothetical protein E7036_02415 [Opitutales bacterium]|nr:hypothetical protein [Opitutales bacterium]